MADAVAAAINGYRYRRLEETLVYRSGRGWLYTPLGSRAAVEEDKDEEEGA